MYYKTMEPLQEIEIALIQYISSVEDDAFLDEIIEALYNLQTSDEKQLGKSVHKNGQGFDASDAVRMHANKDIITRDEKVELAIKYATQVARLISDDIIKAPKAFFASQTSRPKCEFKPMDFRESDDSPIKPKKIQPHDVDDDTFVVDDGTIIFEDGTHIGTLPKRRNRVDDSSEDEDEPPQRRRKSVRLAQRRRVVCESESDSEEEEEEEDPTPEEEEDNNALVTAHGIWRDAKLVVPSKAFLQTVMCVRDEIIRETTKRRKGEWNPELVLERVTPMMASIGRTINMDDMDRFLYMVAVTCELSSQTRGTFRIFDAVKNAWVTSTMKSCVVYAGGFHRLTLVDESKEEWTTDSTMLYSITTV